MASIVYNSFFNDLVKGNIDFDVDTFKAMLVTSAYTPDKDHAKRSAITNEVTGTGYTAGGQAVTATVDAVDNTNDRQEITFGNLTWSASSITARGLVIYKSRGGLASADELVAFIDFTTDKTSTSADFNVTFSSKLRFQQA